MKKKIIGFLLSLTVLMSVGYVSAFATTSSTNAGKYGTLTGVSSGGGRYVQISTRSTKPVRLYMHSVIKHNNTGEHVGTPAFSDSYYQGSYGYLDDEIDMDEWRPKFEKNSSYAMYTSHEIRDTENYVVYTVATGNYTPGQDY